MSELDISDAYSGSTHVTNCRVGVIILFVMNLITYHTNTALVATTDTFVWTTLCRSLLVVFFSCLILNAVILGFIIFRQSFESQNYIRDTL